MAQAQRAVRNDNESDTSLTLTRIFDAPQKAVFEAWLDPEQVASWIGPRSIKAEVKQMEPRVGGAYSIAMEGCESGQVTVVSGTYREIVPYDRLVFSWAWEDTNESHVEGHDSLVTLTFRALGTKTEMTLLHERLVSKESRDSHGIGWSGSFDKLAEMLAGQAER